MPNFASYPLPVVAAFALIALHGSADASDPSLTVQQTVREGRLEETVTIPGEDSPALRFNGPTVTKLVEPEVLVVLEDFETTPTRWTRQGLPPVVWSDGKRLDFSHEGQRFIGTTETGSDRYDDPATGSVESAPLNLPHRYLSFLIGGGDKRETAYVAILDAKDRRELARYTGRNAEQMHRVTVDLPDHAGRQIVVRIVDTDRGDWGHINADSFVSHATPYQEDRKKLTWKNVSDSPEPYAVRGAGHGLLVDRVLHPKGDGLIHVQETITAEEDTQLLHYDDRYTFQRHDPDFLWSQSIKRQAEDVIPHWQYKSPAIIFQSGPLLAALVPDLDVLTSQSLRQTPTLLDLYNAEGEMPTMTYGVQHTILSFHSIYTRHHRTLNLKAGDTIRLDHYLMVRGGQPEREGFREVVRFLWDQYGREALLSRPDQQRNFRDKHLETLDDWRREAWHDYAGRDYREYEMNGQQVGTLISKRAGLFIPSNPDDAMFQAWFQTLRTALGWHIYAQRTGEKELARRARTILTLALAAPRNQGAFATIFWHGEDGSHNWESEEGRSGYGDYYHAFDMAWTGYWLLRWIEHAPDEEGRIMGAARGLGDLLLRHQRPNGYIPSWYNEKNFLPRQEFSADSGEVAGCALFLSELGRTTGEEKYVRAAEEAMRYIEENVLPRHRWLDFEVYLSCSPKPYDFYDLFTRQHPQNNLCQIQAAMAALSLHKATGEKRYLDLGTHLLDYLLLTQQVSNHPLQTPAVVGGFTTQNTDAEWSDARQAYAADLLFAYYEATGDVHYLERAVAAMRSTFAVAPFENWSHVGHEDHHGAFTGFHWGTGSAMTSAEFAHDTYRDIFIHAGRGHGIAINGATLRNLSIKDGTIAFDLETPFQWDKPPVLVVRDAEGSQRLLINGHDAGKFEAEDLEKGVELPLPALTASGN